MRTPRLAVPDCFTTNPLLAEVMYHGSFERSSTIDPLGDRYCESPKFVDPSRNVIVVAASAVKTRRKTRTVWEESPAMGVLMATLVVIPVLESTAVVVVVEKAVAHRVPLWTTVSVQDPLCVAATVP